MAELADVRAEIKAWEHSFKETNGRSANVEDIKANAAIAEKYKLYKKLSRVAAPSNSSKQEAAAPRPSTPPRKMRPKDPTSVLLSKTRQVQPAAPLAAFNPFSPQKKQKGKQREASPSLDATPRRNLFGKPRPTYNSQGREDSPDPFPPIESNQPSSSTSTPSFNIPLPAAPTSAITRARKRLRGEPVSPSPNKEKRRRVTSQIAAIPFPNLAPQEDDSDDDMDGQDADSSFVDNSPVKLPAGGKSFSQLFEETAIQAPDFFGVKAKVGSKNTDTGDPVKRPKNFGANTRLSRLSNLSRSGSVDTTSSGPSNPLLKSKLSTRSSRATSEAPSELSTSRSSTKRPASDGEADEADLQPDTRPTSPLIPPSPPPNAAPSRLAKNIPKPSGKSQGKKKAKLEDPEEHSTSDSDGMQLDAKLKIVSRHATRIRRTAGKKEGDDVEFESDPVLGYDRPRAASPIGAQQQEEGSVEVNLPDELRRVLALQQTAAPATVKESDEDALVKGLLYGRRTKSFNANRGGEIWDVGEDHKTGLDEEANRLTEGEDDWEGEPVPWEVAEL